MWATTTMPFPGLPPALASSWKREVEGTGDGEGQQGSSKGQVMVRQPRRACGGVKEVKGGQEDSQSCAHYGESGPTSFLTN